jgi:hypothetical protein
MKTLKALTILLALAFIGLNSGCTKKEDQILGKWDEAASNSQMEFTKDKIILTASNGKSALGKWEWVGDDYDRIAVTLTPDNGRNMTLMLEKIKISGDTMSIAVPMFGETPTTVKRVKK